MTETAQTDFPRYRAEKEPADSMRPNQFKGRDMYRIVRKEDGRVVLTMALAEAVESAVEAFEYEDEGRPGGPVFWPGKLKAEREGRTSENPLDAILAETASGRAILEEAA